MAKIRALVSAAIVAAGSTLGCAGPGPATQGSATATRPAPPTLRVNERDFDRDPCTVSPAEALEDLELGAWVFADAYAGVYDDAGAPNSAAMAEARRTIRSRS